jgi:exonuclease SbcC
MKILRISGRNLASLAGAFDVDFQREPLASCGLFAISGPTGAGKSTLLDALCVALYDATPRLARAGSRGLALPDVGDETVTPHDTRNLLRRGAAEGHAEVDFTGNDGQRYRARWSVRRARGKADGSLQKTEMSLCLLQDGQAAQPGQPIGGTNSEVKAEIRQRIGLSFEQFTRAVLLAQNEFSAFLKADDNERGELLETLTGSALYTAISRLAFQRAKDEQAQLQRLAERLAEQQPLGTEQRLLLDNDSAQAASTLAGIDSRRATLERELRWHQEQARRTEEETQARGLWEQAEAALRATGVRRERLARVEAVQEARPLLAEAWRIDHERMDAQAALEAAAAGQTGSAQARSQAEAALSAAAQDVEQTERHGRTLAIQLDQAKALDARILATAPMHEESRQALAEAAEAACRARQEHDDKEGQWTRELAAQQLDDGWLAQHRHWQALAEHWPRCDMLLVQAGETLHALSQLEEAHDGARKLLAERRQEAEATQAALTAAGLEADTLAKHRAQAAEAVAGYDAQGLLARKDAAQTQRDLLTAGSALSETLSGLAARSQELQARDSQMRQSVQQAELALAAARSAQGALDAARHQAERSLRLAEAASGASVETLRNALEDDTPCPVCGALDHPYRTPPRTGQPQWHAALASLREEMERCSRLAQDNLAQQSAQAALAAAGSAQLAQIDHERRHLEPTIAAAQRAWRSHPLAGELESQTGEQRSAWIASRLQENSAQLHELGQREQAWRAALAAQEEARSAFERANASHAGGKEQAARAQAALEQASATAAALAERRTEAMRRLDGMLDALDGVFGSSEYGDWSGDWRTAWRAAPEEFHAARREQALQWQERQAARERRLILLDQLGFERQARAAALAQAGAEQVRAGQALARSQEAQDAMLRQRALLLDGQAVAQVEAHLERELGLARARLAQATEQLRLTAESHARHTEAVAQARQRQASQARAAALAVERLEQWLTQFNGSCPGALAALDRAQLDALMEHDAAWFVAARAQLQAIGSACDSAAAVLTERLEQRQAHLLAAPPGVSQDAHQLEPALAMLAAERQAAAERASALRLEIAQDDARRRQTAATQGELAAQEASSRRWAQLNELIGSADGKKFRNYAQRFTLDVLLAHANRHLRDLARRYRLERIGESLALMVVDQDMGDEPRSVHSLSGGESFLVSLALALGLASLASDRVRVESLFIDEGFGSLDAETLRVAMDALDTLQAMGRKVGVISHVQEMAERIGTRITVKKSALGRSQLSVA